jgi:hypothetical protein
MFLFDESKRYNSYQQREIEVDIQLQRSWARRRQEIQYIQLAFTCRCHVIIWPEIVNRSMAVLYGILITVKC